jgi:hypothetical protein
LTPEGSRGTYWYNSPTDLILDYAIEPINWPGGMDDQVWNTGMVSASTFILAGGTGLYTFGLYNHNGDPTDCCDNGLNPIDFKIEMSPVLTQPTSQTISTKDGYGIFVFPVGGASTGTEDPNDANALLSCLAVAKQFSGCARVRHPAPHLLGGMSVGLSADRVCGPRAASAIFLKTFLDPEWRRGARCRAGEVR